MLTLNNRTVQKLCYELGEEFKRREEMLRQVVVLNNYGQYFCKINVKSLAVTRRITAMYGKITRYISRAEIKARDNSEGEPTKQRDN
jgi:hypothetical protein